MTDAQVMDLFRSSLEQVISDKVVDRDVPRLELLREDTKTLLQRISEESVGKSVQELQRLILGCFNSTKKFRSSAKRREDAI